MTQNLMSSTSGLPQVLVATQITSTAETTMYTGPASSAVRISHCMVSNPTASPVNIAVSVVKSGGTAGTTNRVLPTYSLAAGDVLNLTPFMAKFLGPGDFISALAGTANAVNFELDGVVFS